MDKKRIGKLFLLYIALLFLHVGAFTNEKLQDKLGAFTGFIVLLTFLALSSLIKRYFEDIPRWLRNVLFFSALAVMLLLASWMEYF